MAARPLSLGKVDGVVGRRRVSGSWAASTSVTSTDLSVAVRSASQEMENDHQQEHRNDAENQVPFPGSASTAMKEVRIVSSSTYGNHIGRFTPERDALTVCGHAEWLVHAEHCRDEQQRECDARVQQRRSVSPSR
jgi:hypothetical protein